MPAIKRLTRVLSGILFALALLALAFLLFSDLGAHFRPSAQHQPVAALALIFAGLSFLCLQWGSDDRWKEKLKGILLGVAFVLWGGEQFLPAGSCVTAADSAVVIIFVADLGLVVWSRLMPPSKTPTDSGVAHPSA
jgi:hypothetical protein